MAPRSAILSELRTTLAIAVPLALANLAHMAIGVTDTVIVGRLGSVPLAAAGLGATLYITAGVMLQGVVSAVAPLTAHAFGAGDRARAARIAGAGLLLAAFFTVPLVALVTGFDRLLLAFGYDPELAVAIGAYLHAIAWGAPGFLGFAVVRSFLAAQSRTRPITLVLATCIATNAGLNVVLVYGRLGAPPLGVAGSGFASAINHWLMFAGLSAYICAMPNGSAAAILRGMRAPRLDDVKAIARLGLPIGGLLGLEIGVFVMTGVLVGLLGAKALAANQIASSCVSVTFMVPLGVSQAATVRVAQELGAGRAEAARRAGWVALGIGGASMAAAAVVLWTTPMTIIRAYIDAADPANREVVAIALKLIAVAALFQVFDGIQTVAAGALRGYKDTTIPMLLAAVGYWGIGFAGSVLLGFPLGFGASGLWAGLAVGIAIVAVMLTVRLAGVASATAADAGPADA